MHLNLDSVCCGKDLPVASALNLRINFAPVFIHVASMIVVPEIYDIFGKQMINRCANGFTINVKEKMQ